jgi:opine dehydrogenase
MPNSLQYAVIGAGNGGKAMAAHMALMGFSVKLYNRNPDKIEAIRELGGIRLESFEGGPHGFGELELATSRIDAAIRNVDMIMVVVPSSAHADIAARMSAHLKDGQIIVLHPGRTGGALEFSKVLRERGCEAEVTLAETDTFIYASRSEGPAEARIFRIKNAVPLAALPASSTRMVLDIIKEIFPEFVDGKNVLHTGLNNMGAIFHPALTILNSGRIESTGGDFEFYVDGVTNSTAKVLEVLDRERVTVASSLGVRARTGLEWLKMAYNVQGDDLYEAIQNQEGYYGIKAPKTLHHRYIFEDVPMSLVPIASLARRYGVSVNGIDSIIRLACFIHSTDYWRQGRSLDRLGIEHLSVSELKTFVNQGVNPRDKRAAYRQ